MKRLTIRDGLVGPLIADLQDTQNYILGNLEESMRLFIEKTGLKIEETSEVTKNFRLYSQVHNDKVVLVCKNLTPVVFKDYEFIVPDSDDSLKHIIDLSGLSESDKYYVWLHKTTSGDYNKQLGLEIVASASNASPESDDYILLYEIELTPLNTIEITKDYRNDNVLRIRPDGDYTPPDPPDTITVQTVYQDQLLKDQSKLGGDTNMLSPHTNLSVSNCYLKIEWNKPESNIYAYEVRVSPVPLGTTAPAFDYAMQKIILDEAGTPSAMFRVADGVKYSVAVRCIDNSANKNYGEWSSPETLVAGTDLLTNIPAPPEMAIVEYNNPTMLFVDISVPTPPDAPYFVQLFRTNAQGANAGLRRLVYEGDPGMVPLVLEESVESVLVSSRVVGPGGICSEFVLDEKPYSGTAYDLAYNAFQPAEFEISIPLYINEQTGSRPDDTYLTSGIKFALPSPGGRARRILFHSRGSVLTGTHPPLCDSLELLVGTNPEDAISIDISEIPRQAGLLANRDDYLHDFDTGVFGLTENIFWQNESPLYCWVRAIDLSEQTTFRIYGTVILYYDRRNIDEV